MNKVVYGTYIFLNFTEVKKDDKSHF